MRGALARPLSGRSARIPSPCLASPRAAVSAAGRAPGRVASRRTCPAKPQAQAIAGGIDQANRSAVPRSPPPPPRRGSELLRRKRKNRRNATDRPAKRGLPVCRSLGARAPTNAPRLPCGRVGARFGARTRNAPTGSPRLAGLLCGCRTAMEAAQVTRERGGQIGARRDCCASVSLRAVI